MSISTVSVRTLDIRIWFSEAIQVRAFSFVYWQQINCIWFYGYGLGFPRKGEKMRVYDPWGEWWRKRSPWLKLGWNNGVRRKPGKRFITDNKRWDLVSQRHTETTCHKVENRKWCFLDLAAWKAPSNCHLSNFCGAVWTGGRLQGTEMRMWQGKSGCRPYGSGSNMTPNSLYQWGIYVAWMDWTFKEVCEDLWYSGQWYQGNWI